MELDDLKTAWRKETEETLQSNKKNMEQLQLILKEKTAGTLTGIKGKYERIISFLMVGILANIAISPFLHFLLGDEGPVFRLTFGGLLSLLTIVIFGLIVIFFYWLKYKSADTELKNESLQHALSAAIARQRKSLQQEIAFICILFSALFISGRLSSQFLGHGNFGDIFRKDILLAMAAGFLMMGFYIYKRTKACRSNITELEQYLQEFKENQD